MKTLVINEFNLNENEIDETVTRLKAFLVNSNNELYYAISNGGVQLPGGHVEKDEEYTETIKREIQEEVGITLEDLEIPSPFFKIKQFVKTRHDPNKHRISNVIYYFIRTDKERDAENIYLTEREKKYKFEINKINFDDFEEYLKEYIDKETSEINKAIENEVLIAYRELKRILA